MTVSHVHLKSTVVRPEVLAFFQREFDGIPVDPYCEGGYRHRAMTRYACAGEIRRMPMVPLYQAPEYNPIPGYGGIARDYPNLTGDLPDSPEMRGAIQQWLSMLDGSVRTMSVHQIRTRAPGLPVPEGKHRDGNDWVGILVVRRWNVAAHSGRTRVWDNDGRVVFDGVIPEGMLVSFDDRVSFHDTSPVEAATDEDAYRDVFVFSAPDHSHYMPSADTRHGTDPSRARDLQFTPEGAQ